VLLGDASKARAKLGWQPKTRFPELVKEMVEADCRALGWRPAKPPRLIECGGARQIGAGVCTIRIPGFARGQTSPMRTLSIYLAIEAAAVLHGTAAWQRGAGAAGPWIGHTS